MLSTIMKKEELCYHHQSLESCHISPTPGPSEKCPPVQTTPPPPAPPSSRPIVRMSPWIHRSWRQTCEISRRTDGRGRRGTLCFVHIRFTICAAAAPVDDAIVSRTWTRTCGRAADGRTCTAASRFLPFSQRWPGATKCKMHSLPSLCPFAASVRPSVPLPASLPPFILVSAAQGQSVQNICTPRQAAAGGRAAGRKAAWHLLAREGKTTAGRASCMPHSCSASASTSKRPPAVFEI